MIRKAISAFGFTSLAILVGCYAVPSKPPAQAPLTPDQIIKQSPIGRFQIVGSTNMVALDTKMGLVCRTWDWDDPKSKTSLPLCLDLALYDYRATKQASEAVIKSGGKFSEGSPEEKTAVVKLLKKYGVK